MKEYIHYSCLGLLCEKLGTIHYQRPYQKVTLDITKVTCPKCIEKLKESLKR